MFRTIMALLSFTLAAAEAAGQELTRGIGVYPGRPSEAAAVRLVPGDSKLRDVARNRAATASSQYDNNLTAQLVTCGMPTGGSLRYLRVSTPDGPVPHREQEWSQDENIYTYNIVRGEDTWLRFDLNGYSAAPDELHIAGKMAYDEKLTLMDGTYSLALEGSNDGRHWTVLARKKGTGLPG
ncbi:MAG: hypothetical protein HUK02_10570, partial [Bacteroidaceae bacterium]|nr:hypothetical protein [Bacteroidaceae bacterium]